MLQTKFEVYLVSGAVIKDALIVGGQYENADPIRLLHEGVHFDLLLSNEPFVRPYWTPPSIEKKPVRLFLFFVVFLLFLFFRRVFFFKKMYHSRRTGPSSVR